MMRKQSAEPQHVPVEESKRRGGRAESRGDSPVARQLWVPNGIVGHGSRTRREAAKRCKPGTSPRLIFLNADGMAVRP